MKRALIGFGFWLILCAFGVAWLLCTVAEFLTRTRWPRRRRRDLADTFDPVRTLRR
jgi:hypothetical protein